MFSEFSYKRQVAYNLIKKSPTNLLVLEKVFNEYIE